MEKKRIFVLSGKMGSGKSTYAKLLQDYLGKEYSKVFKFAEVLYKLHDACLPILKEYEIVEKDIVKEGPLLQVLGTEYGRKCIDENVWVNVCRRQVQKYLSEYSKNFAIIDDCRFENEFDAFHPIAHMIRLRASLGVRKARCSAWRDNTNHASETDLDTYEALGNFDVVIETSERTAKEGFETLISELALKGRMKA